MSKRIDIGVEDAKESYKRFADAWNSAESSSGTRAEAEVHLNFESFETLLTVMTPKRLELLKTLRQQGPLSVKGLAGVLGRDYKNVHVDTAELEAVDLIQRTEDGLVIAPWDVIDAHVRLVA